MSTELSRTNDIIANTDKAIYQALKTSLYPGASDESIAMVLSYCQASKLDPMLKPVHLVPMYVSTGRKDQKGYDVKEKRDIVMPGINLYRILASRSGCAGVSEPEFGEDVTECIGGIDITYPKWCKIIVKRIIAGQVVEFTAKEYWKENYATAGKDKPSPNAMWTKRPYGQLAKCTEAQAHRKAFPEIGAMPTAEEMEGKHLENFEYEELQKPKSSPGKGVQGLKAKLGIVEEMDTVDYNEMTGEVIETEIEAEIIEEPKVNADTVIFLLESAETAKELMEGMKHLKDLAETDKKRVYAVYKKKEAELKK